jgi:branched-chain amino acid transport system substrate-binding protein
MPVAKAARLLVGLLAAVAVGGMAVSADAQEKKIKIGVIYDLTGPLAGGGSEPQQTGVKIMLDQFSKTGGEVTSRSRLRDARNKPDVAINEAVRLIEQEKVNAAGLLFIASNACRWPPASRVAKFPGGITTSSSGSTTSTLAATSSAPGERRPVRPDDDGFHCPGPSSARARTCVAIIHEDEAYGVDGVRTR